MDEAGQVESYSSAAADRHLDAIDNIFVDHLLRLYYDAGGALSAAAWGLDIGTGPGQIPVKILKRIPHLQIVGIDRSRSMLKRARENSVIAGVSTRLVLIAGDAHLLPFPDHMFSMVLCNSMLHHARDAVALLREIDRVAHPNGAVLLRDLRRPSRLALPFHLWRHGRYYRGVMRKLFNDSVRAAYTFAELEELIGRAKLRRVAPFRFGSAHMGFERRENHVRDSEQFRTANT